MVEESNEENKDAEMKEGSNEDMMAGKSSEQASEENQELRASQLTNKYSISQQIKQMTFQGP